MTLLDGKKIVVGVTGSISIYKSLELIRLYIKAGAKVRVIMTEGAQQFIQPLTFESISQQTVLTKESESWANDNNHIDIGKWADMLVIAPASANTINKISHGIADNLLTQTVLAYTKKRLIAPAANTYMYLNPFTQEALKKLRKHGMEIVEPIKKELACGDVGMGALAEVEEIFNKSVQLLQEDAFWLDRSVVISGGGTIERIDDVRFISNFSSGKMASSLARALYFKGAKVVLVASKIESNLPQEIHVEKVEGAEEMHRALALALQDAKKEGSKKPYLFMAAAVSDYKVHDKQDGKLKKKSLGASWSLALEENIDVLQSLDKEDIFTLGFKAEMDKEYGKEHAKAMLKKKNLDAVCFNDVGDNTFGSDQNAIILFTKNDEITLPKADKFTLALSLVDTLSRLED